MDQALTLLSPDSRPANTAPDHGLVVLCVRDLVVTTLIGIYDYELDQPQRLRVNLEVTQAPATPCPWTHGGLTEMATALVTAGHTNLQECLAERLADAILADARASRVLVRVEKLDAFMECEAVGVEITRTA